MVERACDASNSVRQAGLDELCRRYWKPVYHYLRLGWARSNEDAKDLAQAFFLWLVEGEALRRYEPHRARFRTFLKTLLRHFVQHQDEALGRLKRGGGVKIVDLEDASALEAILADPRAVDPEKAFEQAWRSAVIARAVDRVRKRLLADGRGLKFRVFEEYYQSSAEDRPTYAALADRHGLKESEVQHALIDVREEVRMEIRMELAETASDRQELQEEWNAFLGA